MDASLLGGCKRALLIASASLCLFAAANADDRDFSGTVRRIFDGDSFLVLVDLALPAQATLIRRSRYILSSDRIELFAMITLR